MKEKNDDYDADDDCLFQQVALQRFDGCPNQSRAVVTGDHFHSCWQRWFDLLQFLFDSVDDIQSIHPVAHYNNPANGFSLALTSPEDETISNTANIILTGVTSPKAVVAVAAETGQQIVEADTDGEFTAKISLEGGYNNISVTAFDAAGNSASKSLLITYTTSKI